MLSSVMSLVRIARAAWDVSPRQREWQPIAQNEKRARSDPLSILPVGLADLLIAAEATLVDLTRQQYF